MMLYFVLRLKVSKSDEARASNRARTRFFGMPEQSGELGGAEGLDQLLWHWVSIEALVGGDSDEPVSSTIRERLARMLSSTQSEQEAIKTQVRDLYRLRNDLVHGNMYLGLIHGPELYRLREIARRAILWVASRTCAAADTSTLPSRDQVLSVLACN